MEAMRTLEQLAHELDEIIQSHYYAEDFELVAAVRAFHEPMAAGEKSRLSQIVLRRVVTDGSIVDVLLCGLVVVPSAAPVLVDKLNREPVTNQTTRVLIETLRHYPTDAAYEAVERFLDSDQEMEALRVLAAMDFARTLPLIVRRMRRASFDGLLLHILHDRARIVGLPGLIENLKSSSVTRRADFADELARVMRSKPGKYNPFSQPDIGRIIDAMQAN
jgi:hypothetical protein